MDDLDEAQQLDAADPLAFARERFRLPDGVIYLDGNSLGALPAAAPAALAETAERQWGEDLIASWTKHDWIDWPTTIAAKLAPIVGAKPSELLIADSTSVCLFKLLAAAVQARPGRKTILTQQREFPDRSLCRAGPRGHARAARSKRSSRTRSSQRSTRTRRSSR